MRHDVMRQYEGTDSLAAMPDFLVGQDPEGHWLAVETHGLGGGLFASRDAALRYARSETSRRPGAIAMAGKPIRLV